MQPNRHKSFYYTAGILFVALLVVIGFAYVRHRNYSRLLEIEAEVLDTSFITPLCNRLQATDRHCLSEKGEALYNKILSEYMLENERLAEADSLNWQALKYYKFNTTDSARIGYLYMLRCWILYRQHRPLGASNAIVEAAKYGRFLEKNPYFGFWLNSDLADVYGKQHLWQLAEQHQKKALSCAYITNDTSLICEPLERLSRQYAEQGNYGEALKQQQTLLAYTAPDDTLRLVECLETLAYVRIKMKSAELAQECLRKAEAISPHPSPRRVWLRGEAYREQGRRDSAACCFARVLAMPEEEHEFKAKACESLYRMECALHHDARALGYLEQYLAHTDSFRNQQRDERHLRMQNQREYSLNREETENAEYKLILQNALIFKSLFALACLLLVLVGINVYVHRKRAREKLLYERTRLDNSIMQQQKMEAENRLLQERTASQQKDLELSALKLNYFRNLNLLTLPLIYNSRNGVRIHIGEQDWQTICQNTDACFAGFTRRLKESFPQLKEEDIRFCCLIKMELPIEFIGMIFGIEKGSVSQRKQRLRTKMQLDQTLDDFIREN